MLGSRSSPLTVQSSVAGYRPNRTRKTSHTHLPSESELINRLRREAAERTGYDDGVGDYDLDSTHSDVYGGYDDDLSAASEGRGAEWDRLRKRSYLMRLDEDSALTGSLNRPAVTRRSISRELFNEPPATRVSSSRPVTRRSVSRELQLGSGDGRSTPLSAAAAAALASGRRSATDFGRSSRERSLGRDLDFEPSTSSAWSSGRRSESLTRGGGVSGLTSPPSRPSLASQGRSLTQNEFSRRPTTKGSRSAGEDYLDDDFLLSKRSYGTGGASSSASSSRFASLEDRGRSDWRRVSVPERGKDFKSLPRKYNR